MSFFPVKSGGDPMVRRIIAAAFVLLGLSTLTLWVLLLFRVYRWYTLIPKHDPILVALGRRPPPHAIAKMMVP